MGCFGVFGVLWDVPGVFRGVPGCSRVFQVFRGVPGFTDTQIQLAFAWINEKVPEIQNHNFLELCIKTLSLQY